MLLSIGNPQMIRNLNEYLILEVIVQHDSLSRAEISRRTGLSKPTVSSAVQNLLQHQLIAEIGQDDSHQQGRKGQLLSFNPTVFYIVTLDIGADYIRTGLTDLAGNIIQTGHFPLDASYNGQDMLEHLKQHMDRLIADANIGWDRVRFLSAGIPAVVHPENGTIHTLLPQFEQYRSVLSSSSLASLFPCEILLDNDVNLATIAEKEYGAAQSVEHMVYVSLGEGVGAGIMIDSKLYRGLSGSAGEMGRCLSRAGDNERLEEQIGGAGIRRLIQQYSDSHSDSDTADTIRHWNIEMLMNQARQGNADAYKIIEQYGQQLSLSLINLASMLAPEMIVFGGEIGEYADVFIPTIQKQMEQYAPVCPHLTTTMLTGKGVIQGAAWSGIHRAFQYIREDMLVVGGKMLFAEQGEKE
ncbi:ROK family transcriptional regulator [Paenibacillus sp. KACC 21273]|uniref:ROK family transcriptional regulator n=1 Tax=Paenibacillus sp. KACC 21273 TaxID=3025665 RepID=UPI002367208C|nr:ROK family transcriptional regulator [Paenibacillus sp. KACC 21273]WDF51165.1 ROK family transcriptional regulator [Paenibacillus sp. KACC 21273]